jgi:soluble lytic murein transglycosylase-like protein
VPRLLTKHTYVVIALVASIVFPAAALASSGAHSAASTAGIADAKPVGIELLRRPIERFRQSIRVEVKRREAQRRARLRHQREAFASLPGGVSQSTLDAIAACESGGDPGAVSSDGTYRGLYQFDYGTWASVGGSGDPAAAPEAEQDYRAALLMSRAGSSPWPVCG